MPADGAGRPLERAQLVWQRAIQLAGPRAVHDRFGNALDLLRAAHHDPTTMTHALSIGRSRLRTGDGDGRTRAAVDVLEAAISFLGVKPRSGDLAKVIPMRKARQVPRKTPTNRSPGRQRPLARPTAGAELRRTDAADE